MRVYTTSNFDSWLEKETEKSKGQILALIQNIIDSNYFGDHKNLGEGLLELKWRNGRRLYYTVLSEGENYTVLLLGGNKNGQKKDIKKARAILERET